eukprot:TRINITY_DN12935_c0_g1_i1.p1 TRINITY_DN12935_c0_g1~~TRINITY_DN12935_c0_g1_i1.p1  ORF type:complete len:875 (-),score=229.29 TRINITY_DN12935_c0_g1_i1:18-2519(-)
MAWNWSVKEMEDTQQEHSTVRWEGVWSEMPVANLVHMWFNKNYSHAIDYFKNLRKFGPKPDTEVYNIFFSILEDIGTPQQVIEYYADFSAENQDFVLARPNALTFSYIVKAYVTIGDIDGAFAAFEDCKARGLTPTNRTYAVLLDTCTQSKDKALGAKIIAEAESHYEAALPWYQKAILSRTNNYVPEEKDEDEIEGEETETEEIKLVEQKNRVDIEWVNAKMYFYGIDNPRVAEQIFDEEILGKLLPSYNSYQRLIEIYAAHKEVAAVAQMVKLMKQRNFELNNERTKWTLMDCYIKTEDPRILEAIESTYKRTAYRTDPQSVYYIHWLKSYKSGGGSYPINEELFEKGTRKELAEAFVNCMFNETGPTERGNIYIQGVQDSVSLPSDPQALYERREQEARAQEKMRPDQDPLSQFRQQATDEEAQEADGSSAVIDAGQSKDDFKSWWDEAYEPREAKAKEAFESVTDDVRTKLIQSELEELLELGVDVTRIKNFAPIYSREDIIQSPVHPITVAAPLLKEFEKTFGEEETELSAERQKLNALSPKEIEALMEKDLVENVLPGSEETKSVIDEYLLDGEEVEGQQETANETDEIPELYGSGDDTPFYSPNSEETAEGVTEENNESSEVKADEKLPPIAAVDYYYIAKNEKLYKNEEDTVRGLRLKKLRGQMRTEIARLRQKEQDQKRAPAPVHKLTSPALDYLREAYIKAREEDITVDEVVKFTANFEDAVETLQVEHPTLYQRLYTQYQQEVEGRTVTSSDQLDNMSSVDVMHAQLDQLSSMFPDINSSDTRLAGALAESAEADQRIPGTKFARGASARHNFGPLAFRTHE